MTTAARTRAMKSCARLAAVLAMACLRDGAAAGGDAASPVEIIGFSSPEAVVQAGDFLYVANLNRKDDGFISKVNWRTGKLVEARFLPRRGGLRMPMGMVVVGDTLYVADTPSIVGFDLKRRTQLFELPIADTGRLNDLVLAPGACGAKTCFFVSDDARHRILKVIPGDKTYTVHATGVHGANGLAFDAATQTIYVAGLSEASRPRNYRGALYKVTANPVEVVKLVDTGTFPDGIGLRDGRVYFSDWGSTQNNGYIASIALDDPTHVRRDDAIRTMNGPADIALSRSANRLFIPALVENTVIVQPLPAAR